MTETLAIAFICAKLKGYKIKEIFRSWTIYPIVIMFLVNLIGQATIFNGYYKYIEFTWLIKTMYMMSLLPLVIKYELYKESIIGSLFAIIGGALNDIAIKANGGYMPVFPSISYLTGYATNESFNIVKDIHVLGGPETKLFILTDFIDLGYCIMSIGDIFIRIFVFIIIFNSIKSSNHVGENKAISNNNR